MFSFVPKKWFYSKDTHYIVNNLTLSLTNKEIEKQYDAIRAENFDIVFFKSNLFVIMYVLLRLY
jgi:hypothetical protein